MMTYTANEVGCTLDDGRVIRMTNPGTVRCPECGRVVEAHRHGYPERHYVLRAGKKHLCHGYTLQERGEVVEAPTYGPVAEQDPANLWTYYIGRHIIRATSQAAAERLAAKLDAEQK